MIEMSEDYIYETFAAALNDIFKDMFFHIAYQEANVSKKYGTLYKIDEYAKEQQQEYFDRESPKELISTIQVFSLQIDLYSDVDNLLDYAKNIIGKFKSQKSRHYFKKKGFTILDFSTIRNIPTALKGVFEYRRSFDISVGYVDNFVFDVEYILEEDIEAINFVIKRLNNR